MSNGANRKRFHGAVGDGSRECAYPGCADAGEFRAPSSRGGQHDGPPQYLYLCLDHVREFNSGYNYFDGMDVDEIYAEQHPASGWRNRTTWADGGAGLGPKWADFSDPLDAITARFAGIGAGFAQPAKGPETSANGMVLNKGERAALTILELEPNTDRSAIRRAYAAKLRLYHPDRNGGDRSFEAALGRVVEAYKLLKSSAAFAG